MSDTYNGWTNYSTWRVNLECFDGATLEDLSWDGMTQSEVASAAQEYVDELLCGSSTGGPCGDGLALSYARAFVSDVNWYEIAEHLIRDYEEAQE